MHPTWWNASQVHYLTRCFVLEMPRKRNLKTNRSDINENQVRRAIIGIFNGSCSAREAVRVYGIKRSTLQCRIKKILRNKTKEEYLQQNQILEDSGNESEEASPKYSSKYTNRQVFSLQEESELESYIMRCSDLNYGLTYFHIQKLAYEYGSALPNCKIPKEWHVERQAKDGWRRGFMERHPALSLRKPESTSLSRSTAFNKFKVDQFFSNLQKVFERFKFPPERIFNLDETGVTTVMKTVKVVSKTGKKQVSQAASAERGELVTFIGIISASGQSLPPVYVFPRIRNVTDFMTDAPVSSLALGNKSGWMTSELFPKVLEHFVKHTRCCPQDPVLLLVDNHESHVSLSSVRFCKTNGIVLLSFAPHTTHRMQPLDVGVFGPFKTFCSVAFNDWMVSNPGKTISVKTIPELTHRAYLRAFTTENIVNSFKKPGIWPLNRLAFGENDFTPSMVTDKPLVPDERAAAINTEEKEQDKNVIENEIDHQHDRVEIETEEEKERNVDTEERKSEQEYVVEEITENNDLTTDRDEHNNHMTTFTTPRTINILSDIRITPPSISTPGPSCSKNVSIKITPESIRPFPKAIRKESKTKRTPGTSKVYTDTPEKERLEQLEKEKLEKLNKKKEGTKRNVFAGKTVQKKPPQKKFKESIKLQDSSSSDSDAISLHDDSCEDLSDEFDAIIKDVNSEDLYVGDFVLVKFKAKNNKLIHFVGQILEIFDEIHKIKFLRRKGLSTTFYFPPIDDIVYVNSDDVISKLETPSNSGTSRTASFFHFCYNFGSLTVN